jgi:predicted ATP-grasp superfamily ATP-dependent carboligase
MSKEAEDDVARGDLVLLLEDYRQTITAVRSLGRAGYDVIVGKDSRHTYSEFSRYAKGAFYHPSVESPEFISALEGFLEGKDPQRTYVFPIGESSLVAVTGSLARLSGKARLVIPPPEATRVCLDKAASYRLAAELGVPFPRTEELPGRSTQGWDARAARVGFPCVVKRTSSVRTLLGHKAVICWREQDFARFREHYDEQKDQWDEILLIQEWAPGYRHNCHFAAYDGKVIAYFQQRVLRTDRIDGTGYGVENESVEPSPELRHETEKLAAKLGYTGVGCAQFLVDDSTGRARFLELNPRLDANTAIAYLCGYDFPRLALECARRKAEGSGPPEPRATAYPVRRPMHWLYGDFWACAQSMRGRKIPLSQGIAWAQSLLSAVVRIRNHTTWSVSDPLPTGYLYSSLVLNFVARRLGRLGKA